MQKPDNGFFGKWKMKISGIPPHFHVFWGKLVKFFTTVLPFLKNFVENYKEIREKLNETAKKNKKKMESLRWVGDQFFAVF